MAQPLNTKYRYECEYCQEQFRMIYNMIHHKCWKKDCGFKDNSEDKNVVPKE